GILVNKYIAQRRCIGVISRGDQWLHVWLVHGSDQGNQVWAASSEGSEGISRDGTRVEMSSVRSDDRDHLAIQSGQLRVVQIGIDAARESTGVGVVPAAS